MRATGKLPVCEAGYCRRTAASGPTSLGALPAIPAEAGPNANGPRGAGRSSVYGTGVTWAACRPVMAGSRAYFCFQDRRSGTTAGARAGDPLLGEDVADLVFPLRMAVGTATSRYTALRSRLSSATAWFTARDP